MTDDGHIAIVSGLPRSGTSMLMKMLAAGGLEPLVDDIRKADDDNPGGYYEFEQVKKLTEDVSWVGEARGKVVKVISQLLRYLPDQYQYKVLFARRELNEILASQRVMLQRRGQPADSGSDAEIGAAFRRHLAEMDGWLADQNHLDVLHLPYAEVLQDARGQSKRIKAFMGLPLDEEKMAGVVDDNLYRQRS